MPELGRAILVWSGSPMRTEHYVFAQRPLGSLKEWQGAIAAARYPLQLNAIQGSLLSNATIDAALSGGPTSFIVQTTSPGNVIRPWHREKVTPIWRCAIALSETGNERSAFAVTLAAHCYAVWAGGVFYDPGDEDGIVGDLDKMRAVLSELIGYHLDQLGLKPDPLHPIRA